MKEFTIEEKAKSYDKAKARMSRACNSNRCTIGFMNEIFPELTESEDERIRKMIINHLTQERGSLSNEEVSKAIAWLEKQSDSDETKAKTFLINKGYPIDANGTFPTYEEMYNIIIEGLEKQNELKHTDNVEPKFHEGEWVIDNNGKVAIIYDLQNAGYVGHYTNGTDFVCKYDNEHLLHLWTINEATEGDVLIASDNSVFIYAGSADRHAKFYAALTKYSALNLEGGNWEDKNRVHPATKEQRDLLFEKIKDAGYEWDAEKKELKKIYIELADFEKSLKHIMIETLECGDTRNLKADAEMLLRLAQKQYTIQ